MVVGFTCAISAYHHWRCEFESHSSEVYSIQHYVIKFVSDLQQVVGFSPGPPVSSTNKTDRYDITEILLKVALNTVTLILQSQTCQKTLYSLDWLIFNNIYCKKDRQYFNSVSNLLFISYFKYSIYFICKIFCLFYT
jgi:hypothetical protein